jgi:hypothetical protein
MAGRILHHNKFVKSSKDFTEVPNSKQGRGIRTKFLIAQSYDTGFQKENPYASLRAHKIADRLKLKNSEAKKLAAGVRMKEKKNKQNTARLQLDKDSKAAVKIANKKKLEKAAEEYDSSKAPEAMLSQRPKKSVIQGFYEEGLITEKTALALGAKKKKKVVKKLSSSATEDMVLESLDRYRKTGKRKIPTKPISKFPELPTILTKDFLRENRGMRGFIEVWARASGSPAPQMPFVPQPPLVGIELNPGPFELVVAALPAPYPFISTALFWLYMVHSGTILLACLHHGFRYALKSCPDVTTDLLQALGLYVLSMAGLSLPAELYGGYSATVGILLLATAVVAHIFLVVPCLQLTWYFCVGFYCKLRYCISNTISRTAILSISLTMYLLISTLISTGHGHSAYLREIYLRTIEKNPGPKTSVKHRAKKRPEETLELKKFQVQLSNADLQAAVDLLGPDVVETDSDQANPPTTQIQSPSEPPPPITQSTPVKITKMVYKYCPCEIALHSGHTLRAGLDENGEYFSLDTTSGFYTLAPLTAHPGKVLDQIIPLGVHLTKMVAVRPGVYRAAVEDMEVVTTADLHLYYPQNAAPTPVVVSSTYIQGQLFATFPTMKMSETNYNAALGFLQSKFVSVPGFILLGTIQEFLDLQYLRQVSVANPLNRSRVIPGAYTATFTQPIDLGTALSTLQYTGGYSLPSFYRLEGSNDKIPPNLTDNEQWSLVKTQGYNLHDLGGYEHSVYGHFNTRLTPTGYRWYATTFLAFLGERRFQVLDNSPGNMEKALYRLYQARGGSLDEENELRSNQRTLLVNFEIDPWFVQVSNLPDEARKETLASIAVATERQKLVARQYARFVSDHQTYRPASILRLRLVGALCTIVSYALMLFNACFARLIQVALPHPKAQLYRGWYQSLQEKLGHAYNLPIMVRPEGKNKYELCKPGKHGRLFVSYGEGYLNCSYPFAMAKEAIHGQYELHEVFGLPVYLHICTHLDPTAQICIFREGLQLFLYSDDMLLYYRSGTEVFIADLDISACDNGNTYAMFIILENYLASFGLRQNMSANLQLLRQAIRFTNPYTRGKNREFFDAKPKHIFQGSGCPETTLVNTLASTAIAFSVAEAISHHPDQALLPEILKDAAKDVGHMITVVPHDNLEQATFLKYAQFMTQAGVYIRSLVYGAILRGLGTYMGDLDHVALCMSLKKYQAMPAHQRVELYLANVVTGLKNEPSSVIMDALRFRFKKKGRMLDIPKAQRFEPDPTDRSMFYIETSSLIARYGGTEAEYLDLAEKIRTIAIHEIKFSSVITRIMSVDYGL